VSIHRWLKAAESFSQVDGLSTELQDRVCRALNGTRMDRLLRGSWLGHPVHPLLVTVPIGAWSSASLFDVMPRQQTAARRMVAVGLLMAPPSAIAGLADYSELDRTQRRVAIAHAGANAAASACLLVSYAHRVRGRQLNGAAWTLAGLTLVGVGGALGGHLSYALGAGVSRWQDGADPLPEVEASDRSRWRPRPADV
jgi:uncharacterized membrane protein